MFPPVGEDELFVDHALAVGKRIRSVFFATAGSFSRHDPRAQPRGHSATEVEASVFGNWQLATGNSDLFVLRLATHTLARSSSMPSISTMSPGQVCEALQ